jgi:hypothetical protein
MTPSDLLMTLIDHGVRLKVVEDRLVYAAPRATMTAELVEQLREHKGEVIALLARRTCPTCGSAGRCVRRVPMEGGGWTCQAMLDAGLLSNLPGNRRWHHVHYGPPATSRVQAVETATGQASLRLDEAATGCGERVPVRTAEGLAWVRCTGPETCDGVCTHGALRTEAAS